MYDIKAKNQQPLEKELNTWSQASKNIQIKRATF